MNKLIWWKRLILIAVPVSRKESFPRIPEIFCNQLKRSVINLLLSTRDKVLQWKLLNAITVNVINFSLIYKAHLAFYQSTSQRVCLVNVISFFWCQSDPIKRQLLYKLTTKGYCLRRASSQNTDPRFELNCYSPVRRSLPAWGTCGWRRWSSRPSFRRRPRKV